MHKLSVHKDSGERKRAPYNAVKIIAFDKPHNFAAAVTYGRGIIDKGNPSHYRRKFEMKLPRERLPVKRIAEEFCKFFMEKWNQSADKEEYRGLEEEQLQFYVGGFDKNKPDACVYRGSIPEAPRLRELSAGDETGVKDWVGGYREEDVKSRLRKERERISSMLLQEVADLAKSSIETIIDEQPWNKPRVVDRPVITCTIAAKDGSDCFNTRFQL